MTVHCTALYNGTLMTNMPTNVDVLRGPLISPAGSVTSRQLKLRRKQATGARRTEIEVIHAGLKQKKLALVLYLSHSHCLSAATNISDFHHPAELHHGLPLQEEADAQR